MFECLIYWIGGSQTLESWMDLLINVRLRDRGKSTVPVNPVSYKRHEQLHDPVKSNWPSRDE
jgi:hypothetical protein